MAKFKTDEQQLETCITMFNPLDVNIDTDIGKQCKAPKNIANKIIDDVLYGDDSLKITSSVSCPKFAEDPKNVTVEFEVYLVDSKDFHTSLDLSGKLSSTNFSFSYRLPITGTKIENLGGSGTTIFKTIDKRELLATYNKIIGYLQTEINKHVVVDSFVKKVDSKQVARELVNPKLYAVAYVVIENKVEDDKDNKNKVATKTVRPDYAMKKYKLDDQEETDYDDFMLESVKRSVDDDIKDKVYFFKCFKEIKEIDFEKEFANVDIPAESISTGDDSKFHVKAE